MTARSHPSRPVIPTPDHPPLPMSEEDATTVVELHDSIVSMAAKFKNGVIADAVQAVFERWGLEFSSRAVQIYWQTVCQNVGTLVDIGFSITEIRQVVADLTHRLEDEEGVHLPTFVASLRPIILRAVDRHLADDIQRLYDLEEKAAAARAALEDAHATGASPVAAPTSACAPGQAEAGFVSTGIVDWVYATLDLLSTALLGLMEKGRGMNGGVASKEAVEAVANLSIDYLVSVFHWKG